MSVDTNIYIVKKDSTAIPYANTMLHIFDAIKATGAFSYVNAVGVRAFDAALNTRIMNDAVISTMPLVIEHELGNRFYPNLIGGGTFMERSLRIYYGQYPYDGGSPKAPASLLNAQEFIFLKLSSDQVSIAYFNQLSAKLAELLPDYEIILVERDCESAYKTFPATVA